MSEATVASDVISEKDFLALMAGRTQAMLRAVAYVAGGGEVELSRPLLGELLQQSTQLEELLDSYGARGNRRWRVFRSHMAIIKRFSGAAYELLHIEHVLPSYRLLEIERDFISATDEAMDFTSDVLIRAARRMLEEAARLGLPDPSDIPPEGTYDEALPQGKLPNDLATRKVEAVSETVTRLATAFLALAAESDLLHVVARTGPEDYASCLPVPVNAVALRHLQHQFHNMQSVYDTFVLSTESESIDPDLSVLRGHISVVFHLLVLATALAHYYERHIHRQPRSRSKRLQALVDADTLRGTLMGYALTFAGYYLAAGQNLCQDMLKRYAEVTRVTLPVPRYRGFHVRPSTLVAKIVLHYGSEVRMILDDQDYDASSPLEIFRANEKINAEKRRWLATEIAGLSLVDESTAETNIQSATRRILLTLADQGRLVIYAQPLQLPDAPVCSEGTVLQRIVEEIARLQATGKIDIHADLSIEFVGDKRVLADIKLLADNGYGEDNSGNNIPLPKRLAYLRRTI